MGEANLTADDVKGAIRSLKPKKIPGYDNISLNVVNATSDIFFTRLKYFFNLWLQQKIFPENFKIAKVFQINKKYEELLLTNYSLISVLLCISELLERIICNQFSNNLSGKSVIYEKQFAFQTSRSTDHAILLFVNQLYLTFYENKFTLGIFNDLSKVFDTVEPKILTNKLDVRLNNGTLGGLKVTYYIGSSL